MKSLCDIGALTRDAVAGLLPASVATVVFPSATSSANGNFFTPEVIAALSVLSAAVVRALALWLESRAAGKGKKK